MPGIFKYNRQDLVFAVIFITTIERADDYFGRLSVLCAVLHTVICGAHIYPVKIINSYIHRVILSSHDSEAKNYGVGA